jgi:DNA uptake protein ComE-like DNA-binding protein
MLSFTKHEQRLVLFWVGVFVVGVPLARLLKMHPAFSRRVSFLDAASLPQRQDLNTVTFDDLVLVPTLGRTRAEKIIRFRMANGDFVDIDDLKKVPGLNANVIEQIAPYLTVKKGARDE